MIEFLSPPETPKRSKSMSLHPTPDIDTRAIKQIGNYTLGVEVGSGAFGKVVLGKHILTGETVAIKILDKMILSQTPEDYELVRQEISILKIVKHKYIVQLYEILQTPQHIFIVMEYCEGKDLMDYILTKTRLSELESLKFFQQLINALFYLHSQNISHRDVKIDNMLLDRNKDLKLVDFGLSTKYTDDTLLDQPCGTVVYAAPEVLDGNEYHGMLADVWSSGIVLFGMASGYLPFCDQDDEVNKKHVLEGKIDLPEFFSPMLKDLLKHMLDINPITRYTLQDIREHPWFNMNDSNLIPGIIIGYNLIPVDDNILNLCVAYNCDKDKVELSVKNNKYDAGSALYYLLVRKITRKGFESISDLSSELFIDFILDDNNLVKKERDAKTLKSKDKIKSNRSNLKGVNNNNSAQIIKSNSTASHRTSTNHDTISTSNNNKEIFSSSSRHIDDLGAAPRLLPQTNDNNRSTKFLEKKDKLNTNRKTNKVISAPKHKQYNNAVSKGNNNKTLMESKNKLKPKKNLLKKKNNDCNKKRLNNSAQHRQIKNKNKKETENTLNNLKNNNRNTNTNMNINNKNNKNNNQANEPNLKKEQTINMNDLNNEDTALVILNKEDAADAIGKAESSRVDELRYKENFNGEEFNNNTEQINNEIRNNKHKNIRIDDKTPIKKNTKSLAKDIKETTYSAYQNNSQKYKKKYDNQNKLKNQNQNDKLNSKNILKSKIDNNNNSIYLNNNYLSKEKGEKYLGHSCIDINPSDYLATFTKKKKTNINNESNANISNNSRTSYKNIVNNNGKKVLLEEIKKQKGITTNIISSDKFNGKAYNNKTIYNKNKTNNINKNNNNKNYFSKSIHTTYNPRFNEKEKIEESPFLFSSNKKKDYSLCKKNNVISVQNLNHSRFEKTDNFLNNSMSTKNKRFERNKITHKNLNITSPLNKLNMSLNKNTNNYNTNKYFRYKNSIYSSVPKINKQTDYDPNNTIYEFNYKYKNKNRIRLDFNPNKNYELTANENNQEKKKKNK